MEAKGNNLLVRPEPHDRVLPSGIIIPDTITPKNLHHARVLQTNEYIKDVNGVGVEVGASVIFTGKNTEKDQIIANRQVLYWDNE